MGHIQTILVPMDGSPASVAGLSEAVTLAEELGAAVEVLHVEAPDDFEVGSSAASSKVAREQAAHNMARAVADAERVLGDRITRRTEAGDPVRKILERASNASVIIIGTHGRVGRMHALLGSVAEAVVRNAPCPVLTVRCPAGEEESFAERIHHREGVAGPSRPSR